MSKNSTLKHAQFNEKEPKAESLNINTHILNSSENQPNLEKHS